MSENRATVDVLNDLLDARTSDAGQLLSEDDPALVALVTLFYAADDVPGPPPELANHIWREMEFAPTSNKHLTFRASEHVFPLELTLEPDVPGARPGNVATRSRWALSFLATAALVLLALAGSLLALQGTHPSLHMPTETLYLPANSVTINSEPLLEGLVTAWPEVGPPYSMRLQRVTVAPGDQESSDRFVGNSVVLFAVESGQLTVDADAPAFTNSSDADGRNALDPVPAGTTLLLDSDDQFLAPEGVTLHRRNDGLHPVTLLELRISDQKQTLSLDSVDYSRLMPDKVLNNPPAPPAILAVRRLELLPGSSLPIGELPGLQMLVVESGSLELLGGYQLGSQAATGSDTVAAGSGQAHFDTTTGLANRGSEPVVFLVATITPAP